MQCAAPDKFPEQEKKLFVFNIGQVTIRFTAGR
jgi:hypothetical protein